VFHTVICDLLGIRYPILQGAMQGGCGVELVAAVSEAGGLGVLPTFGGTRKPMASSMRFYKTVLDEFYRVAFRKKIYGSLTELQADLDVGSEASMSNGLARRCFGKAPMKTFLDAIPLAKEKMIAA
jgi:NAD(P)H-dependent flavin oxidoreductase YrpB (nitropropane dioxygenase family)